MIGSRRRVKVSRRHWGPEAPPGGEGSGGCLGPQQGTGAVKQNGFEVFALAEIGSPESNANNPEYFE